MASGSGSPTLPKMSLFCLTRSFHIRRMRLRALHAVDHILQDRRGFCFELFSLFFETVFDVSGCNLPKWKYAYRICRTSTNLNIRLPLHLREICFLFSSCVLVFKPALTLLDELDIAK
jgi:hypothetical protein